jgi:hypothetical protein
VRAGPLGDRSGSRRLVRQCSEDGDQEPDSKGQQRRCTARDEAVF